MMFSHGEYESVLTIAAKWFIHDNIIQCMIL